MTQNPEEVAIIVGEASNTDIYFACATENYPPNWEYITFKVPETSPDESSTSVEVLAQVTGVYSVSDIITQKTALEAVKKIIQNHLANVKTWGETRILGYKHSLTGKVVLPRKAAVPGTPIFLASDDFLADYFQYAPEKSLQIGNLISRKSVPVSLNIEGFNRHLAILAQTGAGKSYTTGVLIEELLEKGATVVIIDPHSDYVYLSQVLEGSLLKFADRIAVYKNPQSTHQYREDLVEKIVPYQVEFSSLDTDDICAIMRVPENATRIKEVLYKAIEQLIDPNSPKKDSYQPSDLKEEIEKIINAPEDAKEKVAAKDAKKYIRRLERLKVFGPANVETIEFLRPASVSVLDLSGLDDKTMDLIAYLVIEDIYAMVKDKKTPYPVFLVVEESHRFVPAKGITRSTSIINTVAAEGRKFGMFLTLITQRPSKIHPDTLSQCNSQIIMKITNPKDQQAIEDSSERMSHELIEDLPGLNPGEAVIIGTVTRVPVMVSIRTRKTMEGGSDIDLLKLLDQAVQDAVGERREEDLNKDESVPDEGDYSDV